VAIGAVDAPDDEPVPGPGDLEQVDASPVRAFNEATAAAMMAEIDAAHDDADTLGGVIEVIAYGLRWGSARTCTQTASRCAAGGALMGIQAMKGVEIGDASAPRTGGAALLTTRCCPATRTRRTRPGSHARPDESTGSPGVVPPVRRLSNRAGGIEGGMTNGEPVRVRVAMKPISTVPRALRTVDVATGEAATAIHQRSDACAVPRAGVVAEAMVALVWPTRRWRSSAATPSRRPAATPEPIWRAGRG
jgi:chorismate synthase